MQFSVALLEAGRAWAGAGRLGLGRGRATRFDRIHLNTTTGDTQTIDSRRERDRKRACAAHADVRAEGAIKPRPASEIPGNGMEFRGYFRVEATVEVLIIKALYLAALGDGGGDGAEQAADVVLG